MSKTAVNEISQGKIWSGYDAKAIGLIDVFGGIEKAIEIAVSLSNIKEYRIISLPKKKDPLQELMLQFEGEATLKTIIMRQLGYESKLINPIEQLLNEDKIQAKIPFVIELK